MLVIVRPQTKRRIHTGLRILVAVVVLTMVFGHLYNMYHGTNLIREGWLRDDKPSGHPMRVETDFKTAHEAETSKLDQFVVKLRDFYRKDD